jgi:hypothetical protein
MKKSFLALVLFLIPFMGCSLFINENDGYEDALKKWEETKNSNYEFLYNVGCFCPQTTPAIVVVSSDTVYQILEPESRDSLYLQTGESTFEYAGDLFPDFYHTIDELFDTIKKARKEAHELDVSFDKRVGFPESINIDYYKDAVDDEIIYSVTEYQPYSVTVF